MSKIIIINNNLAIGGIQMSSASFANYCVSKGHDVSIVTIYKKKREITVSDRITIVEPSFEESRFKIANILRTIKYLRCAIKTSSPDVIVAHGEWTNGFVVFSLLGLKKKIYLQDHMNPDIIPKLGTIHRYINRCFYPKANGVIALSNYSKEMIMKYYSVKNVAVIPNPVRDIEINEGIEKKHVVTIGRVSKEKGHIYLIKAWKELQHNDWILDVVGDGPEIDHLKQEAAGVNSIVFHGFQKDIASYLSVASIFVLPSLSECFPLALIEAMSVGKACVATDCMSGKDTIVENGKNGLLIDPRNVHMMAVAIKSLIDNEALRIKLGSAARHIKEDLSSDKLYSKYLKFIGA